MFIPKYETNVTQKLIPRLLIPHTYVYVWVCEGGEGVEISVNFSSS